MLTKDACAFAGIDSDRLNEAISAGLYSHAPETVAGRARYFGDRHLIALKVFAELTRIGFKKRVADKMTGEIMLCEMSSFCNGIGTVRFKLIEIDAQVFAARNGESK